MTPPLGIFPVRVGVDGASGVTLWAPEWRDAEGEKWTAFLGTEAHVALFGTPDDLRRWVTSRTASGLEDHPDWPKYKALLEASVASLTDADTADLDAMYDAFSRAPLAVETREVSRRVQLAQAVADAVDDDALATVLGRRAYAEMSDLEVIDGLVPDSRTWGRWGAEVAESWGWVVDAVARHVALVGGDGVVRPVASQQPGPWRSPMPLEVAEPAEVPSRAATVVVTLFFGVFGAIPAAMATAEARRRNVSTQRYWEAFALVILLQILAVVLLVVGGASMLGTS